MDRPPTNASTTIASLRPQWDQRIEVLKSRERELTSLSQPAPKEKSNKLKEVLEASKLMATELIWAIQIRDVSDFLTVLEKLGLEDGVRVSDIVETVTRGGNTVLHVAAQNGSPEILRLMAKHFPQLITRTNITGDTVLHVAARSTQSIHLIDIVQPCYADQRRSSGSQIDCETETSLWRIRNDHGNTALHEAVMMSNFDAAYLLFKADKDVANHLNKEGKSPLYLAVEIGDNRIIGLLLKAPLHNRERHRGNSPLHAAIMAVSSGQISKHKFQSLVVAGVIKSKETERMFEPTSEKFRGGMLRKIQKEIPEIIYLKDQKGWTPLHFAASIGNHEVVHIIRKACPLSSLEWDLKGHLPIHIACKKGHVHVVKEFVQHPGPWSDPMDLVNQKGQNILHIAAKSGKDTVVKYILSTGKLDNLLNQRDKNGNTPLHLASKYLHPKVLLLLTQVKRLNISLANNEGLTARDIVLLRQKTPPTFREFISFAILKSIDAPLSEKVRRIRRSHTEPPQIKWIKDRVNAILLVAILVATVTFAAGFAVPGGINSSDDKDTNKIGMATLLDRKMFQLFTICDVIAMYSSTMGSFILLGAQLGDFHIGFSVANFALYLVVLSLITMSVAFMAAVHLVVSDVSWLADTVAIIGIIFLLMFLGVFILLIFPLGERALFFHHISDIIFKVIISFSESYGKLTENDKVIKKMKSLEEKEKDKDE
ncbi:protein ACCELERATED CELL DEATH 6-like [Prosopis cineraria]|uniref:protein ACCELERATED CELL DEATH 6-like n=1 Tax=Prosopis cineraria TaxID=364024 RepID=UPI00240EC5D0|nr:protein ACCELERATED CELL DEATH 6-like [Prosopis cineraria]